MLKSYLPKSLLGVYLNPDEIEACIKKEGSVDLQSVGIQTTEQEVLHAFKGSKFLQGEGFSKAAESLSLAEGRLYFVGPEKLSRWNGRAESPTFSGPILDC